MPGSKQTQTTKSAPWAPAQAGLQSVLDKAQTLGNKPSLWTPKYSADTKQGINQLATLGRQPSYGAGQIENITGQTSNGMGDGMSALRATARGDSLNGNPYLDAVLSKAMQDAGDRVNAQFSSAGRYGSGAHSGTLGRELGGLETQARMENYNTERDRQLNSAQLLGSLGVQGAGLASQVDGLRANQAGLQLQAGQLRDAQETTKRMAPINAANWQAGITGPIAGLGSESTTISKTPANIGGMIAGGAMTGLGLMTGNPAMAMGGLSGLGGGGGGGVPSGGMPMAGAGQPFFGAFSGGGTPAYAQNSMFNLNKLY